MDSSSFSFTIVAAATAIGFFTLLNIIIFLFYRKLSFHQENKTTASSTVSLSPSPSSSLPLSPPTSSSIRNWMHHVFPSFHGEDVRQAFLSHILKEFRRKGINPFIDNDIVRGKSIGPELIEAIRGSRIAIVLLSKNYASSTWCLDELVEIMRCRDELGQTVMALFYQVDPTDVKKQTGDFGKVFRKTCKGKTKDNIRKWIKALEEVAKIAGYHSNNWDNEATMIEKIANDVSNKLNISAPSSDFDGFVGMESHMMNMESLLRLDSEEVRMIGIWGPSGIGKTTIARFLFNRHSEDFQLSVFMENIKTRYTKPACSDDYGVKKYLQNEFLSQIVNHEGTNIPHLGIIKDRLKDKKVLVVLDDVDQLVQLEAMAKETWWFGACSRIIVTTQDRKLLKAHGIINNIYKVNFPSSDEAFEMFCMYAFGQKSPKDGFAELAREVTELAGELPLGLRVMGSYFRSMSKQEWTMELPRVKKRLDGDIESILKLSYYALYEEDKNLFLHIACLFNYKLVDDVEDYLANSFSNVTQGLHVLAEKSLISIDEGKIGMHDLLVLLGKEIVRKQSVEKPWKRQFLVDARDIEEVLNDENADSSSVIGIFFLGDEDITCTSETAFKRLTNLQFLYINDGRGFHIDSPLNFISKKLRMLEWRFPEMSSLPSNFHTKFLVKLDLSYSRLEKLWEGIQPLSNLKEMDLKCSPYLKELPDLSTATNFQKLNIHWCESLVGIPSSIGYATNLQELDLGYCSSLVELPFSIWNAINLKKLNLRGCSSLAEIPSSIRNFHRLKKLDLKASSKLEVFPTNINLESLEKLDLSHCSSSLKSFPETFSTNIEDVKVIKEVTPSSTSSLEIQELGPCIGRMSLILRGMKKLVSLPQLPYSILELDATGCKSLERLDCSFHNPDIRLNFAKCFKLNQEARDLIIHTRTNGFAVLPGGELPECFTYRATGSSLAVKLNQNTLPTSTKFKVCILLDKESQESDEKVEDGGSWDDMDEESEESDEEVKDGGSSDDMDDEFGESDEEVNDRSPWMYDVFGESDEEVNDGGSSDDIHVYITSKKNALTSCLSNRKIGLGYYTEHLYTFEVEAEEVTSTELDFEFELSTWFSNRKWGIKECGVFQLGDGDEDNETSDTEASGE